MIRINSPFGKSVTVLSTFALVFCMTPSMAWAKTYSDAKNWIKSKTPPVKEALIPSKVLSAKTMRTSQGKTGENPYASGQSKWDVMYKGVNLMTGNFTTSGTDLTFEGGYGIPVNVTRSYSANNGEGGPLGKGWTLSVDVRSTAGGIMKSSGSPVRSVPTNFKERPSAQVDPNAVYGNGSSGNTSATSPISAVLATDAGGTEETIQRDADGILSTPPWDKNKIDSVYETIVAANGTNYQVMTTNTVNTPEGTVYVYQKQGAYINGGVVPANSTNGVPEPSNVLKIVSATDRHGNLTSYTYGTGYVSFVKQNGTTSEHPLTKVHMPNGHEITFTWSGNHMTAASDGVRTVQYGYDYEGNLSSVTSPGGKTTTYGYGNAVNNYTYGPDAATGLMTSVTDPRGLQTTISYVTEFLPRYGWTPVVKRQVAPNGVKTDFFYYTNYGSSTITDVFDYTGANYTGPGTPEGFVHGFEIVQNSSSSMLSVIARKTSSINVIFFGGSDLWQKDYDMASQNLMSETNRVFDHDNIPGRFANSFSPTPDGPAMTAYSTNSTTYNFMGAPLAKTGAEYHRNSSGTIVQDRANSVAYAYWGAEKYYQQKAIKDSGGRLSYSDFYSNTAATGKKGQKYRTYDQARANIWLNTGNAIPGYSQGNSATHWRYQVEIADSSKYSSQFDYDGKGRPIDIWKIQSTMSTPWTYVRTQTSYGADNDGSWGQPSQVVEDYGGINRATNTLAYDSQGRAVTIQDATGKQFHTTFDADGVISSIEKIASGTSVPLISYTYGTSGITNGMILTVTDNLSGIFETISYVSSGGGRGGVASVTENDGIDTYTESYTYTSAGDRDTSTYVSQAGLGIGSTVKWQYHDYSDVGAENPVRVFQTLTGLDATTSFSTSEEFQYAVDSAGRPRQVTFAMTPQSWTPSNGAPYYDSSHKATTRARTFYNYDGGGRMIGVYNWWDTLQANSAYVSGPIRSNECFYETTGLNRGLKTQNKFYNVASGAWNLQRTETYGYDANLDYLTSTNYGDGLANANPSWTYDAAGNRASDSTNTGTWTYDNLNRMTASPGTTYTNDVLGNRLTKGTGTYTWDDLNRMTTNVTSGTTSNYAYRADGMRVRKESHTGATNSTLTRYRYDGQMGIEDVESTSTNGGISYSLLAINRYALGARGIDAILRTTSAGTSVSYPLYDAHGNGNGSLIKSGASWSISDERSYNVWGGLRSGETNENKARYSASLGHKQDDESGLIYMRARYYESTTGRFTSQDKAMDGKNWYVYAHNCPTGYVDQNGNSALMLLKLALQIFLFIMGQVLMGMWDDAEGQILRLDRHISQLTSMLAHGSDAAGDFKDLQRLYKQREDYQGLLARKGAIKGGQFALKVLGYSMLIRAMLMEIDWGDGKSGLDILFGNG